VLELALEQLVTVGSQLALGADAMPMLLGELAVTPSSSPASLKFL